MEDILLVPPDRGTILGRPVWKPRYVVVGPLVQKEGQQSNLSLSHVLSAPSRIRDVGGRSSKSQQKAPTDALYLSVYKSKDDTDPIIQHSIASIADCRIQLVAHRKQEQVLPTLTIQLSPDPAADKLRKRRSSRTTGLMTTKESGPAMLYFLTAETSRHSLGDWVRYLRLLIDRQQSMPLTPISPTGPVFVSPFPPAQEAPEKSKSSSSSGTKGKFRSKLQPKKSGKALPSARDQSSIYTSGSHSLRSRKSDLSSHASSMAPNSMIFVPQHYSNLQHSDLPSPASTVDEHPEQLIEGWTMATGRSSALSSPIRGRASISSSHDPSQPSLESSPRITPRETILDRAFQMRYIPGSDREVPGEEKLTSLARFEALMREADTHQRKPSGKQIKQEPLKSTWEDDESDDAASGSGVEDDEDEDSDNYAFEQDEDYDERDASSFKARPFVNNRHNSTYSESGLSTAPSILRPHTAHSRNRPAAQRMSSQPYITTPSSRTASPRQPEGVPMRRSHEKRHSTSDVKNLSFNEFAKRLSGTSSLLLVQSNASSGSNPASGDYDAANTPRGSMSPRGTSRTPEDRCRWRGSIGVFGNEGGFL
ncbi:hypothetical protein F4802DRAFT_433013 [Xylaria palmicola]|nr:hypothetical protein F4802DRAFT_433013 [Xylaria palmicola]